jgi:hypothetical protein
MTKKETIEKIRAAADRVLKKQDLAAGCVSALDVCITKLTSLRDSIGKSGDVGYDDLMPISECFRILDTIYCGYPMVPASPDVEKAATKKVAAKDFADHAAGELEAAAKEPVDKRALRIAALKMGVAAYEAAADGAAVEIPVVAPEAVPGLLKSALAAEVVKKSQATTASPPAAETAAAAETRIEAVAKAASAAPGTAPVTWPRDLAPDRPDPRRPAAAAAKR